MSSKPSKSKRKTLLLHPEGFLTPLAVNLLTSRRPRRLERQSLAGQCLTRTGTATRMSPRFSRTTMQLLRHRLPLTLALTPNKTRSLLPGVPPLYSRLTWTTIQRRRTQLIICPPRTHCQRTVRNKRQSAGVLQLQSAAERRKRLWTGGKERTRCWWSVD